MYAMLIDCAKPEWDARASRENNSIPWIMELGGEESGDNSPTKTGRGSACKCKSWHGFEVLPNQRLKDLGPSLTNRVEKCKLKKKTVSKGVFQMQVR